MTEKENLVLFTPEDGTRTRDIVTKTLEVVLSISFALSADEFFGLLREYEVTLLMDIRASRDYSRARFSHVRDLPYLCTQHGVEYQHGEVFAPTRELREQFDHEHSATSTRPEAWTRYLLGFQDLMKDRKPSTDPLVREKLIEGSHKVVAFACGCAHHCDCHRSYVTGLLARQLQGVKLEIAYPNGEEPRFKSPRRYLLQALPHAGLVPSTRGGRRG